MSLQSKKTSNVISVLIALCLLFNSVCLFATDVIPFIGGFGDILIIAILLVGAFASISNLKLYMNAIYINIFVLVLCIISMVVYSFNSTVLSLTINYFVWGICIAVLLMQNYSHEFVLNASLFIATVTISANLIVNKSYDVMVWTYAIFPCLAVILVHFKFRRHTLKRWQWIIYVPGIFLIIRFVSDANRGGLISLFLLLYFLLIKKNDRACGGLMNRNILRIVLFVVILIALLFYEDVIEFLYNFITERGIDNYSIKKMYNSILSENISNNRDELYQYAWNGFLTSPVFGHGVGGFSVNHGGWPHNFVLQLLYEGGVILFAVVVIPLVRVVYFFIKSDEITSSEYSLFICLFATSVPRLLFSTELWNTQGFWMLITFGLVTMYKYKHISYRSRSDVSEHRLSRGELY